jgi:hypothetical protein
MGIINRIKGILLDPKNEWPAVNGESETPVSLMQRYVLPLVALGGVAAFIAYGVIGADTGILKIGGTKTGLWFALRHVISGLLGYFIATYVIDALAPNFASQKDLGKSAQLVAYSSTPSWLATILTLSPALGFIGLIGLYGIYLFYIGLPVLKKTPEDKRVAYMIVSALVIIGVSFLTQSLISMVLNPLLGDPYAGTMEELKKLFEK